MAVDVSKIPNNSKFDPVREAILQLQKDVGEGVVGVGSINGIDGNVILSGGNNINIANTPSTKTITVNTDADIIVDSLQFTGGTGTQGTLSWNADEETIDIIQNGATLQVGQEVQVHVKNQTGATIPDGTPVYVTGTLGASGRLTVAPMIADGSIEAKYFLGVTTESIPNGEDGKVTTFGKIRGLDTTAYTEGTTLYVSATTAGAWQTTVPVAPELDLEVAIVINVHANNGTIFVRAQNGLYLGLLHDVYLNSPADNQILVYNATNTRWENSDDLNLNGNLVVAGDLTVSGTTTYINTTHLDIGDNIIQLNADILSTTAPTEDAGFYVNRGNQPDASFLWDEDTDKFSTFTNALSTASLYIGENQVINSSRQFLGSSTISSTVPYFTFSGDSNTGVGRATNNKVSLIAEGVKALEASNTGVSITGDLEVGGTFTADGVTFPNDIITSADFSATDNRFKLTLTQSDSDTIEASFDDVVLSESMAADYIPYVKVGGGDGDTTNAILNDSFLKINGSTLELDWVIDGSPGVYTEHDLKMRKDGGGFGTYYEATYAADSVSFLHYASASDIDTAKIGATSTGRVRINDTYSLPVGDGTAGQVLTTDGSGDLSWAAASGGGDLDLQDVTDNGASTDNSISITGGAGLNIFNSTNTNQRLTVNQSSGSYPRIYNYDEVAATFHDIIIGGDNNDDTGLKIGAGTNPDTIVFGTLHVGSAASLLDGTDPDISTGITYSTSKVVTPKLVFLNDAAGDDNYITHNDSNTAYSVNGQSMGAWYEFVGDKLAADGNNSAGIVASGLLTKQVQGVDGIFTGSLGVSTTATNADLDVQGTALIGNGTSTRADLGLTLSTDSSNTFVANTDLTDTYRQFTIINDNDTVGAYSSMSFRVYPSTGTAMADIKLVRAGTSGDSTLYTTIRDNAGNFKDIMAVRPDNITVGGDLIIDHNTGALSHGVIFRGVAASAGEVGIRANGEAFEIYEPEQSNKVWLSIADDPEGNGIAAQLNSPTGFTPILTNYNKGDYITKTYIDGLNVDADTLDGLNSTQFLRSDADDTTTGTLTIQKAQQSTPFTTPFLKLYPAATTNLTGHTTITLGTSFVDNYGVSLSGWRYGTDGDPKFRIKMHNNSADGVDALTIDSAGKIGIGTTTPSDKLQIDAPNSQLRLRDTDDGTYTQFSSSGNLLAIRQNSTTASHFWMNSSGNVGLGTNSPSAKLQIVAGSGQEGIIINNSNGIQTFHLGHLTSNDSYFQMKNNSDVTEVLLRTDGGNSYINTGNVGIGTTSPSGKFNSYINANRQIAHNALGGDFSVISDNNSSPVMYIKGTGTADLLQVFDNTSQVFTIQDGGNVGIGTTSPICKLHLVDSTFPQVRINDNSGQGESGIRLRSYNATNGMHGDIFVDGTGAESGRMGFRVPYNAERLTILHTGEVGIGTTSPSDKLEVAGNIKISSGGSGWLKGYDDHHSIYFREGGNNALNYYEYGDTIANDGGHRFFTGGLKASQTLKLAVADNGIYVADKIGISNTAPGAKLHILQSTGASFTQAIKLSGSVSVNGGNAIFFKTSGNDADDRYGVKLGAVRSDSSNGSSVFLLQMERRNLNGMETVLTIDQDGVATFINDVIAFGSSDRRLKDNIEPISNAIDKVKSIGGYTFDWNENQYTYKGKDVGVVAQEVEDVMPEVVTTREDGYKAVKYEKLVPLLIEAIKEQQKQIDELKARLDA